MNKIILSILFLSFAFCQTPISIQYAKSEVFQFQLVAESHYNLVFKEKFALTDLNFFYFEDSDKIKIKYKNNSIDLGYLDRKSLIKSISKYEEWNDKAIKNNVTLEKEIYPEEKISIELFGSGLQCYNDEFYTRNIEGERSLRTIFLSQSSKRNQIVLKFDTRGDNLCSTFGHPDFSNSERFKFYLDFNQAMEFKKIISQEYINSKKVIFD